VGHALGLDFLLGEVSIICGLGPGLHELLPGPASPVLDFTTNS